jgi:hypothetical protein
MQNRRPLTVYLDSSDYSVLSNRAEYAKCLNELNSFSQSGRVIFVFSCAVVSEMLPINRDHLLAANSRINLMNKLCKRAFPDSSEVIRGEVTSALRLKGAPKNLLIPKYGWMPTLANKNKPKIKLKFPNGANKSKFYSTVKRHSSELGYPARLSELALAVSIGAISEDDAALSAVYESRDIEFLLNSINLRFEISSILSKSIRQPSLEFCENINKAALEFANLDMGKIERDEKFENNLLNVVNNISKSLGGNIQRELTLASIKKCCPGLVTSIMSSCASVIESLHGKNPRTPKTSDFADSVHALYAPYVDFFRADKYMSIHIKNSCPFKSVNVVNNLLELPDMIRARLENSH